MRNTITFGCIAAILAYTACADEKDDSIETKTVRSQEMFLKKTGGYVIRPGSQKGEIVYVNCQTRADKSWIKESITYFEKATKFNIVLKDGEFDFQNPEVQGNVTIFIVDKPEFPVILVAPESNWAAVNVAVIAEEKRPAFFEARFKKELSRAFAYLCGAANSQYPRSLTRNISKQSELDKNPDMSLPVDVLMRIENSMSQNGVHPAIRATYRKACQEGWAAAPTNEYQQAIWDQVHSMPSNPMKIEFDPKKGR